MPYCEHCGKLNSSENKFCEDCGKALVSPEPRQLLQAPKTTATWPRKLPSAGGLLVVICFFFPWILVSCQVNLGAKTSVSAAGYEIATGHYSALQGLQDVSSLLGSAGSLYNDGASQLPKAGSYPVLWLIPVLGLAGLISLNGRASGGYVALVAAIFGIIGLIIFSVKASEFDRQLQLAAFQLTYQGGYWGAWVGFLWQAVLGVIGVRIRT